MESTYVIIITLATYVIGAINKIFVEQIPNKYLPIQNVLIGLISCLVCYFARIETNLIESLIFCLMSTMSAGGIADLLKLKNEEDKK